MVEEKERGELDHARTPCGCAASPMSMILSDSSTQSSGGGITIQGCRDTGPALSSKERNLGKVGQLKILLRRPGIHGVTYLESICASLYRSEVNEVVGSQLSSAPCLATADAPPPSSHHTWTANSWFRRYDRKSPASLAHLHPRTTSIDSRSDSLESRRNESAKGKWGTTSHDTRGSLRRL